MASAGSGDCDPRGRIAARYRHFAEVEAVGRSPLYAEIADAVSRSDAVLDLLSRMPAPKRQPNLLFAVVRYLYGMPGTGREFVALVQRRASEIAAVSATRSTQTNEPARCATLLPVLVQLPQPLALLEVGASAGLCLLPDYYGYDYGRARVNPSVQTAISAPVFECHAGAHTPLPERSVEVVWRAGLDLEPVDLEDEEQERWLEALVWPGEEYRLPRLKAACEIARAVRPPVFRGDLRSDLAALAGTAPEGATLVVFHTAVLAYISDHDERSAFAQSMLTSSAVWIANEGPDVIPGVPAQVVAERSGSDAFLLCVDGEPTAWTDGHGTWIDWRSHRTSPNSQ